MNLGLWQLQVFAVMVTTGLFVDKRNRCTKAGGIEMQKQIQLQKVEVARALGVGSSWGQWSLDAWQGSDLPDESEVQGLFLPF